MNYPKRGHKENDYYTHTDGSVHKLNGSHGGCTMCSLTGMRTCAFMCGNSYYESVEGAYVKSDVEKACDMARAGIDYCDRRGVKCEFCSYFITKECPTRAFLAAHNQLNAWEVK